MKIIPWNTRRIGDQSKQLAPKRMILKANPDLVHIQETKKDAIELDVIKAIKASDGFMLKPLANQCSPCGMKVKYQF